MAFDAADLAAFNDSDMPGYAQATIGAVNVDGRFRATSNEVFGVVPDDRAQFAALATDLSGVAVGDAVTIAGTAYTVAEIREADVGIGMTRLMLKS